MKTHKSFPELKYPSGRDDIIKSPVGWLRGKQKDDGAEGLWRIFDGLYDFSDFVKKHPGGEFWLDCTKGTDITELFQAHHISEVPRSMLKKYYVRNATTKRNSPFTFDENGFYMTLRRRIRDALKNVPKLENSKSMAILDILGIGIFIFAILSCHVDYWTSILFCIMSAICIAWTIGVAHNFLHQKDNWRMYLINFSFQNTKEFRIVHAMSHHMFPNTLFDLEISLYEPFIKWIPDKNKTWIERFGPIFWSGLVFGFTFIALMLMKFTLSMRKKSLIALEDVIPFTPLLSMYIFSSKNISEIFYLWIFIVLCSSFIYFVIAINAAHHHPNIFHEGDAPMENRDWGMHQLHALMDRVDVNGSLFKVLISFGDHGMHHLFPTLDHAYLPYLHEVFLETCKEFRTELRMTTQLDMMIGSYKQMSRNKYNR